MRTALLNFISQTAFSRPKSLIQKGSQRPARTRCVASECSSHHGWEAAAKPQTQDLGRNSIRMLL